MIKGKIWTLQAALIFLTLLMAVSAWAVSPYINYQGKLTDSLGEPINDPALAMTFSIWLDPSSTNPADKIWQEDHTVNVVSGIYNVILGNSPPMPDPGVIGSNDLWIEVTVDGETLSPRAQLTSVTSALWSDKSGDADTLDGMDSTEFAVSSDYSLHTANPSAHHDKTTSFTDLLDTASDAQIPSTITRDTELTSHESSSSAHHSRYTDGEAVSAMGIMADANPLHHNKYTNSDAVAAIKAADGAGSTLDADFLDGQHASEIIDAAADEVRTPISSLPYTISTPGSYYLTGDLDVKDTAAIGITITANNVTIDLMGFSISGPGSGSGRGIYMNGRDNVEIKNGSIRNFGYFGIDESSAAGKNHRIINIRAVNNGNSVSSYGINLNGAGHLVEKCTASNNTGGGIYVGTGSIVSGNTAYDNTVHGIRVVSVCTVIGNIASSNGGGGIYLGYYCTAKNNTVYGNTNSGIYSYQGSSIINNTVADNNQGNLATDGGIETSYDTQINGNTLRGNLQNNIRINNIRNTIEGNLVNTSYNGIYLSSSDNFMANNRVFNNTVDYAGNLPNAPVPIMSLPFDIASSGYYYLTGNLSVSDTATDGITVHADNVTIDLKGFTISGPGSGSGDGISMTARSNVEIKNGTITSFGRRGISDLSTGAYSHRIINIRALNNGTNGIFLEGKGHLVEKCIANDNGGDGIHVIKASIITDNTANNNTNIGIYAIYACTITNNTVYNNSSGIYTVTGCTITNNSVRENGRGISASGAATISGNSVSYSDEDGINANYSLIDGNSSLYNDQSGGGFSNIYGTSNTLGTNKY